MCGIAGFAGRFSETLLDEMSSRVAHRGPDDLGTVVLEGASGRVGIAHRRLSIIDLSPLGRQPMTVDCSQCGCTPDAKPEDRLWLTYNGEIYNFQELRSALRARGHTFTSGTDTEVLLHLYAEHGPRMLQMLNGIFALALYDGRPSGERADMQRGDVLVARDGVGVKPLYVAETRRGVLFASELKALVASEDVDTSIDHAALDAYLTYLWAPAPMTPLVGVRKLRPGELLKLRGGRIVQREFFYDLPYSGQPIATRHDDELAAEVNAAVRRAVERQLVADVPVGAFLSGGLDSSAIVAMMRRLRPDQPIHCYTIASADFSGSEGAPADLPFARRVAQHLRVDLHEIDIAPNMMDHLEKVIYHLDEPQGDPAPINAFLIAEQARKDGIPVLMSGAGGDDIFTGYRRHQAFAIQQQADRILPLWVRRPAAAFGRLAMSEGLPLGLGRRTAVRRMAKILAQSDLPLDRRLADSFFWSETSSRQALFTPEVRQALGSRDVAAPLLESLGRISKEHDPLNRMLYLDAKHFLADHNLNYTDKVGMAFGVEVRVPLLDLDLIKLAATIPGPQKQRAGIGKYLFKRAMQSELPRDCVYRPKTGFGAPLRRWLNGSLRPLVDDTLGERPLKRRGFFDAKAVNRLVALDRAGRIDAAYVIFAVLCIELWARTFLDGAN
jgi:asparagine synthase (glutamine-hydrolysing)